jgi:hypothetical protein
LLWLFWRRESCELFALAGLKPLPSWPLLGKMPLTKKAHEKSLTFIQQSLKAGPHCQAGWRKGGAAVNLGQAWLL